jgi:hypothetical protein
MSRSLIALGCILTALVGCKTAAPGPGAGLASDAGTEPADPPMPAPAGDPDDEAATVESAAESCPRGGFTRDWNAAPALVVVADQTRRLYVIGDVHGDFKDLAKALTQLQVVVPTGKGPLDLRWNAGRDIFVFLGDLIDKSDDSLDVLRLVMQLEGQAKAAGGQVIALAGNHEMAFLADPFNAKAKEFRKEIKSVNLEVCADVYSPASAFGAWLRNRPAAAIVNGIYLAHSGWSAGEDRAGIQARYRAAVDAGAFDSPFTCGDHAAKPPTPGFFNAEVWWGKKGKELDRQTARLGVSQVMFGHAPSCFASKGKVKGYFVDDGDPGSRGLFKMDVDMWEAGGDPAIYLCKKWRSNGGCLKPKLFLRSGKHNGPDDIDDFPTKSESPPDEAVPESRDGC